MQHDSFYQKSNYPNSRMNCNNSLETHDEDSVEAKITVARIDNIKRLPTKIDYSPSNGHI